MSSEENKKLSTIQPSDMAMGVFSSASMYGEYHKIAVNLAGSTLIPKEFQGNASNVMIALNLSSRMGADPLAIMQSMYIVHGKPSFSASFIGGILEESGKFEFLEYRYQGTEGKDDYGCRIVTTVKSSGQEIHGPLITVAMAKAEGWWGKSGSKWPTLTETMLGNRAITFFARRYAGSILLGMSSTDELEDIRDINPKDGQAPMTKADIEDAIVSDVKVADNVSVKQETENETLLNMSERTQQIERVLPGLSRGIYEGMAKIESSNSGTKEKGQLQELREHVQKTGENPAEAMRALWGAKFTNAPRGLQQALRSDLVVQEVSPRSSQSKEESDGSKSDTGKAQDTVDGEKFTADGLVKDIEAAEDIEAVNLALSRTKGFNQPDQKKVMKAASAKNKELAAKRSQS